MSQGFCIGIDLGTTYSLAALMRGGTPEVLTDASGERLVPSTVSVAEDGTVLVGAAAKARASRFPGHTAQWFKRDMGTGTVHQLGDKRMRPEELSALVLREVKHLAEEALGGSVVEAVVTVPAYFGELQRRATRDAAELAGLKVERIINEPTAAALAYGLHQRECELRAVVLDLGGGTFDVTVLEIIEGVIEIQASAGDSRLGGEDFADTLARHVANQLEEEHKVPVASSSGSWARLREAVEGVKRRLTQDEVATLVLPGLKLGTFETDVEFELSREHAEELWRPLIERMRAPIMRALRDAEAKPEDIEEVILVGGATRMPCVVNLAAQLFRRLPLRSLPPDESVAMGAAIQAALKSGDASVDDMVVTDIAPFTLGIATGESVSGRTVQGIFSPIIERGTVLPCSRVETFSTMENGQRQIEVEVYQGEHSLCSKNQRLGSYMVKGIPAGHAGTQQIEVRFSYDLNGILEVDTTIVSTKKTQSLLIEKSPGRLDQQALKQARTQLQRLKFHPREALPNITALNRAEALFQELTGGERARLGSVIAAFRAALEGQDPEEIQSTRDYLAAETRRLRDW